jgi:molecular chaperone GrpE
MNQDDTQTAKHSERGQQSDTNTDEAASQQQGEGDNPESGEEMSHEQLLLTLQDAKAKADQHWNQLLLARAELDNNRRRNERDVENAHKFALEKFVRELLPVKDSLELGLAAAAGEGTELEKLREGMELTLKMLAAAMEKFGVSEVDPAGEKFNPERHQAMAMQESPTAEANTVLTVYQKGYLLNDRLIRPAMVVVSSAPAEKKGPSVDEKA